MESPISVLLPFPFITFLLAAPLPFVETGHSRKANWKPLCEKSGSPCRFSFQFHFFDADITILQGWAAYASVHSWLTHFLCSDLFLIGRYPVCYSLNSSQACLVLLFFTDFRTDVSPLCRHLDLLFSLSLPVYLFPISIIAFYRSNHHFPLQR